MDAINFIQDLAVVLLTAGVAAAICRRIHLSSIVGYLLAGLLIGPYTPPFSLVTDIGRIETLSQVGLVFLIFGIGLGLSLTKMREMGLQVLLATALGAFFVLNLTMVISHAVGWTPLQGTFVAAMLMTSSSAVIAKVMQELGLTHTRAGQVALSVTVLEDIVAVVMLAVLGAQTGLASGSVGVGPLLIGLTTFVVLLIMLGLFFVPRVLRRFDRKADPELLTLIVAGGMFLMALLAVKAGFSLALGAFMLGLIVAETPQYRSVEREFSGARDMFSSVFFVSIGMMIDVRIMLEVWPWVLGLTAFAVIARPIATSLALTLVGMKSHDARRSALALVPLGEFSFLVAQLGVSSKVLTAEFYPMAVGASILTVLLMPIMNRHGATIVAWADRLEPRWLQRVLNAYATWLSQLGQQDAGRMWWRLSKKRFGQIAMEVLFATGLLIFSDRILAAIEGTDLAAGLDVATVRYVFWAVIGVVALIPLVSIWRNISALAMIFGESAGANSRMPAAVASTGVKALGILGLTYWLLQITPIHTLSTWGWVIVIVILLLALAVFYRRLIYWHSEWRYSLQSTLAGPRTPTTPPQPEWTKQSADWSLNVVEHIVPELAAYAGRMIGDMRVRSRFGCTIAEINRQGYTLVAPTPTERLFPGDRLLLLGEASQIGSAKEEFDKLSSEGAPRFHEALLERIDVVTGPHIGRSLAELQIPLATRVLLVGIERGSQRISNPSGEERILTGDRLFVLGTPRRLKDFREWLEGSPSQPKAPIAVPRTAGR